MYYIFYFLILFVTIYSNTLSAQVRDLSFYQEKALLHNPAITISNNQQKLLILQEQAIRSQNLKPLIYLSNDILLTPSLFTNSKLITFRNQYNPKALGYDAFLSNRTFYSGQLNISQNLFAKRFVKANANRNTITYQAIDQSNQQFKKDLEKYVTDQYLVAYQLQLQSIYQDTIVHLLLERVKIAEQLVKNGLISASDLFIMKIALKEQENTKSLFQNQFIAAISQLNVTCNLQDSTLYHLKEPVFILNTRLVKYQFQTKYELDSTASSLDIRLNNTRYAPQLTAYGTAGYMGSDITNLYRNVGFSAGLRLFISLYDGKQRKNFIEQVRLEQENQKATKEYSAKQLDANLFSLLQQIQATKNNLQWIDEKIKLHKQLLSLLKDKMMIGEGSVMDYINALQEYRTNYQNKAIAEVNVLSFLNQYNYINW